MFWYIFSVSHWFLFQYPMHPQSKGVYKTNWNTLWNSMFISLRVFFFSDLSFTCFVAFLSSLIVTTKVKRDHNQTQKRHRISGRSNPTLCFKRTMNTAVIKYTELIIFCKQAILFLGENDSLAKVIVWKGLHLNNIKEWTISDNHK